MRTTMATLGSLAALSCAFGFASSTAEAGGYYYRARSLYITPPSYAYLPVIGQPPIVVYEPVPTYPAPVAGYYGPVAAPAYASPAVGPRVGPVGVGRVRERQVSTPLYNGYRYHVHNPYSPDYAYRVRENAFGTVRFTERWSH